MKYTSAILATTSGKLGGMVGSRNAAGQYFRRLAIPVNRQTSRQNVVRNALASLAGRWTDTLTAVQRTAWETYAANTTHTDRLGNKIKISALAAYSSLNTIRIQTGLAIKDAAPVTYTTPVLTPVTCSAVAGSTSLAVTVAPADAWAHQADGHLAVFASIPKGPGITFFKGPYQYIGRVNGVAVSSIAASQILTMPNPAGPSGSKVFIQVRALEEDGRLSGPFPASRTV